jgi:hypothetical protein
MCRAVQRLAIGYISYFTCCVWKVAVYCRIWNKIIVFCFPAISNNLYPNQIFWNILPSHCPHGLHANLIWVHDQVTSDGFKPCFVGKSELSKWHIIRGSWSQPVQNKAILVFRMKILFYYSNIYLCLSWIFSEIFSSRFLVCLMFIFAGSRRGLQSWGQ